MKAFLFLILLFSFNKVFSQDIIYMADGSKVPGKISEITADSLKFINPASPTDPARSLAINGVQLVFNAAGSFLVFSQSKQLTDKEKQDFILCTMNPRPFDVLIDSDGKILAVNVTEESETEITAYNGDQKVVKLPKAGLVLLIRKNGTHELFLSAELSQPYLVFDRAKIDYLISQASIKPPAASNEATVVPTAAAKVETSNKGGSADYLEPNMKLFSVKALQKTQDFTSYLQAISSVNTNRDAAIKCINLAFSLFLGESAKVEVSNAHSATKNKYKILDYLTRLMIKSGEYDKVKIEYANVNYATKFTQGIDGNYYGSVTFVQKFQGFIDGKVVYGDKTKRNLIIVLKHYKKEVNGETQSGWDVFLGDVGVVETKKL